MWALKETKKLIEMYNHGKSAIEIAKVLARTLREVEGKICRLQEKGLPHKKMGRSNIAIGFLTDKHKGILKARKNGLSIKEMAQKLNIPMNTVRSSLSYLRKYAPKIDQKEIEKTLLILLKKKSMSVGELSRIMDKSKETIIKTVDALKGKGYDINIDKSSKQISLEIYPTTRFKPFVFENFYKYEFKIGLMSDTHLGSKYAQMSLLNNAYKMFDSEKVDFILHAGDVTEGNGKLYRGQMFEMFLHGADEVRDYAITRYPNSRRGTKTYIIPGSHDWSFKKETGYNIVKSICEQRTDLIYRGEESAKFDVKGMLIELLHPSGGASYSISYRPQKIVENIVANTIQSMRTLEDIKKLPKLIAIGHYHKGFYLPYAGSTILTVPALQAQTPYLREKGLTPDVGIIIVKIVFDKNWNLLKITPDFRIMNSLVKEKDY